MRKTVNDNRIVTPENQINRTIYIERVCIAKDIYEISPSESFSPLSGGSVKPTNITIQRQNKANRVKIRINRKIMIIWHNFTAVICLFSFEDLPNKAIDAIRTQGTIKLKK